MRWQYGIVFGVLFVVFPYSSGLYFHIGETERKCFIEEIPDQTMVTGNYKVQLYDPRTNGFAPSSPGIGMHVEIRDPDDKIILSKVYSSEGRWIFTSHAPGEHVICLYTNSTKWFSGTQSRVHLDIQVGDHAIDYAGVAQRKNFQNYNSASGNSSIKWIKSPRNKIINGIGRNAFVKLARARINVFCGGPLDKPLFLSSWELGR
uniref:Transmembrane emp24 domain-containing protein 9 n=1 Tax=Lepeophtheirus salmonis TaxID=72036 RepID=D3PGF2_LEPSM|nr:Transmembrane emp24 domain-containing protein 9 [Lepeophtheirus salmonis]